MRVVDVYRLSRRLKEIADMARGPKNEGQLTPGELEILNHLAEHPDESVGGIARGTRLSKSLVSRYVRDLEGLRLVAFRPDCFDARFKPIELSETARRETCRQADVSIEWGLQDYWPWLSQKQQRDILDLLKELSVILR